MKEIGSHFEYNTTIKGNEYNKLNWLPKDQADYTFTFSGRSAIELALINIMRDREVKSVYMPSYCCSSMLQSFKKYDIKIEFYKVTISETGLAFDIDVNKKIDVFFAISYFGLEQSMDNVILKMSDNNVVVIEDVTHRLLSKRTHFIKSDYLIASLRKWFPIPTGGLLMKKDGFIFNKPTRNSDTFVVEQLEAMKLKTNYIEGKHIDKQIFLEKFKTINKYINELDATYQIDSSSKEILNLIDVDNLKYIRKSNAMHLYNKLEEMQIIKPLFPEPDFETMTPLFIPIIAKNKMIRSNLVNYLIEHQIYCPIHWPVSDEIILNNKIKYIYDLEISLVCDQRYDENEMNKIIKVIGEFEYNYA